MSTKFNAKWASVSAVTKVSDTDFLCDFFESLEFLELPLRPVGCYIPNRVGGFERYNTQPTFAEDATYAIVKKGYVKFRDEAGYPYKLMLSNLVNAMLVLPFVDADTFRNLYWDGKGLDWKDNFRLLQVALFSEIRYEV